MVFSAAAVRRIFGAVWNREHSLLLGVNLTAYAALFVFFRRLEFHNFFLLAAVCAVCYLGLAGFAAFRLGFMKRPGNRR